MDNITTILKSIMPFISINTPTKNGLNQTERKPTIHSISINWREKNGMEIRSHNLHNQLKDWRLKYTFSDGSFIAVPMHVIRYATYVETHQIPIQHSAAINHLFLSVFKHYTERVYSRQLNMKPLCRTASTTIGCCSKRHIVVWF